MRINPKQIEKAMKRMGIQSVDVPADEVVIKSREKDIIIKNPQVTKVNAMGQDTFQITGDIEERKGEWFSSEDVETVMGQTGSSEKEASDALRETGDLADAIMKLKKK